MRASTRAASGIMRVLPIWASAELDVTMSNSRSVAFFNSVPMQTEVSWVGTESKLVGIRFLSSTRETETLIGKCLERLTEKRARLGSKAHPLLVADDDQEILGFLTKALTRHGFSVHRASRGFEALELIRELRPALVLLDILMPGIDGVDICKTMRADVEMGDIPVIFLSALDPERLHQVADEAGATDYLSKPVALTDLINLVGKYLK